MVSRRLQSCPMHCVGCGADSQAKDRDGNVYFADTASNRIYRSGPDGRATVFRENSGGASALQVGPDGRLYASQIAKKRVISMGTAGDEKVVAANVEVRAMAMNAKGAIYFTDALHKTIGYIDPSGKTRAV